MRWRREQHGRAGKDRFLPERETSVEAEVYDLKCDQDRDRGQRTMEKIDAQKTKQRQVQRSGDCCRCFRVGWPRATVQPRQCDPDGPEMPGEQIEVWDHIGSNA